MNKRERREAAKLSHRKRRLWRLNSEIMRDFSIHPSDPVFRAGLVLLAAMFVGTDVAALAALSGQSEDFITRVSARCRKAGVWRAGKARAHWIAEYGDFAFCLDAMVACGLITRSAATEAIKQRASERVKRSEAGLCTNCGRARDSERMTCDKCRASMKASQDRRKTLVAAPLSLKNTNPLYMGLMHAKPQYVSKHEAEA